MNLLDCIPTGRENAISRQMLMELSGLNDRQLRQQIHDLRTSGAIICTDTRPPGGVWLPASEFEIRDFILSMEHRAISTFAAVSSARQALRTIEEAYKA